MPKKNIKNTALLFVLIVFLTTGKSYASEPFGAWLADLYEEASKNGVSQETLDSALADITPIQRVIELDRKQPEHKMTFAEYREKIVHPLRIKTGRKMMRENHALLTKISEEYGVAPQYIVALWGIETNYGQNTGGFSIIPALATLAWEGRREDFFRKELLTALKIIDAGHISAEKMKGSWAGAMGQNQFMPSSFMNFALDGNGDGRKDIWDTRADVFASTANYLTRSGWKNEQRWGREVKLPADFPRHFEGLKVKRTLSQWKASGVTLPSGRAIPVVQGMKASIVTPDGLNGPAFLVYDNYRTIMKWNHSTYFATAVGLIADALSY